MKGPSIWIKLTNRLSTPFRFPGHAKGKPSYTTTHNMSSSLNRILYDAPQWVLKEYLDSLSLRDVSKDNMMSQLRTQSTSFPLLVLPVIDFPLLSLGVVATMCSGNRLRYF